MRHLDRIVTSNPFFSIDGIKHELEKLEVAVRRKTVVSYYRQLGFKSYHASHKPALKKIRKEFRLKCAKEHVVWTTELQPWYLKTQAQKDRRFLFQEDGATCHTGASACLWRSRHLMKKLEYWPAQSSDLNPIEDLWWALEQRIASRRHAVHNTAQLKELLLDE